MFNIPNAKKLSFLNYTTHQSGYMTATINLKTHYDCELLYVNQLPIKLILINECMKKMCLIIHVNTLLSFYNRAYNTPIYPLDSVERAHT